MTGRITHHLMAAREVAARYECTSTAQHIAVEAILFQLDVLLLLVRKIHHRQ